MTIIAKMSFWIMTPKKKLIISGKPIKTMAPFGELMLDALAQFKTEGYVKKLKTSITQRSLHSNKIGLLQFLYNQTAYT
jgi:hypothetical protein